MEPGDSQLVVGCCGFSADRCVELGNEFGLGDVLALELGVLEVSE